MQRYLTKFAHNLIPSISVPCLGQKIMIYQCGCQYFQLKDFNLQEFRDALAFRYRKPLLNVPAFVMVAVHLLPWIIF